MEYEPDTVEFTLALKITGAKSLEYVARGFQMAAAVKRIEDLRDEIQRLQTEAEELEGKNKKKKSQSE